MRVFVQAKAIVKWMQNTYHRLGNFPGPVISRNRILAVPRYGPPPNYLIFRISFSESWELIDTPGTANDRLEFGAASHPFWVSGVALPRVGSVYTAGQIVNGQLFFTVNHRPKTSGKKSARVRIEGIMAVGS